MIPIRPPWQQPLVCQLYYHPAPVWIYTAAVSMAFDGSRRVYRLFLFLNMTEPWKRDKYRLKPERAFLLNGLRYGKKKHGKHKWNLPFVNLPLHCTDNYRLEIINFTIHEPVWRLSDSTNQGQIQICVCKGVWMWGGGWGVRGVQSNTFSLTISFS